MQTVIHGSHAQSHAQSTSHLWNLTVHSGHKGLNSGKKRYKLEAENDSLSPTFTFNIYPPKIAWLKFHLAQK